MNKQVYAAITLAVGLGLSGCGGGGDGEATPVKALVPLAAANYDSVAEASVSSVAGSDEVFSTLDLATAASTTTTPVSMALLASGQPDALARFALSQVKIKATGRAKSAAVDTLTEFCAVSGALGVVFNDADNDGDVSIGDRITVTASNCIEVTGQPAVNGTLSIGISSVAFNSLGDMTSGSLVIGFTQFSSAGLVLNGAAVLSISPSALGLDFDGLSASYGEQTRVYDFTVSANVNTNTVSVAGPITVNGSTYVLATPSVIHTGTGHPVAGTLRISDGHGNRVDVLMGSTSYTSYLYLKGDEVVDAYAEHNW